MMIMDSYCRVCGKKFKAVTSGHLRAAHNMTIKEYSERYPSAVLLGHDRKGKSYEEIYGEEKARQIREKMSKTRRGLLKGYKHSEQSRQNMSKAKKGKKLPLEVVEKIVRARMFWRWWTTLPTVRFCECGCGELIKSWRRFALGHNSRVEPTKPWEGKKQSREFVERRIRAQVYCRFMTTLPMVRVCECGCGEYVRLPKRFVHGHHMRSDEVRERIGSKLREKYRDEKYRRRMSELSKKIQNRPDVKEKRREILLKLWRDREYREKQIRAILRGSMKRPTEPERKLMKIIEEFGLNYKYVGNGEVVIGWCNPDFINVNGLKTVIEVYGCYFHKCPECFGGDGDKRHWARVGNYKKYGYKTLVFWEHEINNLSKDEIAQRIIDFENGCKF